MQHDPIKRPSVLGRMVATIVLVIAAGVAGAVGAAHAEQLTNAKYAGIAVSRDQ